MPFFWCTVQSPPLFPSILTLKHAGDLKPFAIPLHMFSAESGSQKTSFQAEGKGYKFSHSFKNTKYTVQEIQTHLL